MRTELGQRKFMLKVAPRPCWRGQGCPSLDGTEVLAKPCWKSALEWAGTGLPGGLQWQNSPSPEGLWGGGGSKIFIDRCVLLAHMYYLEAARQWGKTSHRGHRPGVTMEYSIEHSPAFSVSPVPSTDKTSVPAGNGYYCCSVSQSCPTSCDLIDCSISGFPVLHYLLEFAQTQVHWVGDVIQPSHPLSSPSPPAFNLSQRQGPFPMSWLFASGGQRTGASPSASVRLMNIQN